MTKVIFLYLKSNRKPCPSCIAPTGFSAVPSKLLGFDLVAEDVDMFAIQIVTCQERPEDTTPIYPIVFLNQQCASSLDS